MSYNAILDDILSRMDLDELRQFMIDREIDVPSIQLSLEVAAHKTRVERISISPVLRQESMHWLKARGFSRYLGRPWPVNGELPE